MSQRLRMDDDYTEADYTTINDLPDTYLHQILSTINDYTEADYTDAAITTTLSTRWNSVFLSQPILNLDDSHFRDPSTVRKFFESMIAARDKNLPADKNPIVSFNLKCHQEKDIPKFVYAALNRGLENLAIDFCNSNFPCLVLNTKTLTFLKLKSVTILRDPDVDLPSLKVLHLESVTFGRYRYLNKILCACPIIHDLVTKDLAVKKLYRTLVGERDTSLSKLVRANISGVHIYFDQLQNAEHLRLHVTWRYNISTIFHNLTYLDLTFHLRPSLREAKWIWLLNLLYKFPKLQTLIIDEVDTDNNYGAGRWEEDPEKQIAPDCLLYHLTTCSLRSIRSINCELQFAKYIMQNSRVLTTMKIQFAKSVETTSKHQMFNELSSINSACQLLFINLNAAAVSSAENPRVVKGFETMKHQMQSGANVGTLDDAVSSAEKLINEVAEAEAGASGGTSKRKSEDADEDGKNMKQKNDSIAPNRPLSGFMFFSKTETESLKKTDPGISDFDLSMKVGDKWMDMSAEEKESYEKRALVDKKRYVDEIRRFKN